MIVVLCPANATTGGPEALHQLVDGVARAGGDAAILYDPDPYAPIPKQYRDYLVRKVTDKDVAPTDLVVIPEIWPDHAKKFAFANTALWWLSVDNASPFSLDAPVAFHFAQSHYALRHLQSNGLQGSILGDFIPECFAWSSPIKTKTVAVNPAKGGELFLEFSEKNPDLEFVAISGMDRSQIIDTFRRCMVFVDFGHHPGKDRMAREASMCGAVVFVRRAGAAIGPDDVPLDEAFKFDADCDGLRAKLDEVFDNFPVVHARQKIYRAATKAERNEFDLNIKNLSRWF